MGGLGEGLSAGVLGGFAQKKHEQFQQQLQGQVATAETLMKMASMPSQDPGQPARLLGAAVTILQDPKKARKLNLHDLVNGGGSAGGAQPMQENTPIGGSSTNPPKPQQGAAPAPAGQQPAVPPPPGGPFSGLQFQTPVQQQQAMWDAQLKQQPQIWAAEQEHNKQLAAAAGIQPGSPGYPWAIMKGQPEPAQFQRLVPKPIVNPDDPSGPPLGAGYDPFTNTYFDQNMQPIQNARPYETAFAGTVLGGNIQTPEGQMGRQILEKGTNTPTGQTTAQPGVLPPAGYVPKTTTGSSQSINPVTGELQTLSHSSTTTPALPAPPGAQQPTAKPKAAASGGGSAQPKQDQQAQTREQAYFIKQHPEIKKYADTYNQSVERYQVMQVALQKAAAGDQQAMLNLLYNHIGMTTGLQKGARITRDVISEAQQSAPWEATLLARIGVGNGFTMTPDLLRGIALTPEQMNQMVSNAKDRVEQDRQTWVRGIDIAKSGYSPPASIPNAIAPPPSNARPSGQSSFSVPPGAPAAPKDDGHTLKMNGKPIAISKGGSWQALPSQ